MKIKSFIPIHILLLLSACLYSCDKDEPSSLLTEEDRELLISRIYYPQKIAEIANTYCDKAQGLIETLPPNSSSKEIRAMTQYEELYLWVEDDCFPNLLLFYSEDKRNKGEVKHITELLIWDYAEKEYYKTVLYLKKNCMTDTGLLIKELLKDFSNDIINLY